MDDSFVVRFPLLVLRLDSKNWRVEELYSALLLLHQESASFPYIVPHSLFPFVRNR